MSDRIERTAWVRIASGPLFRRDEQRIGVVDAERMYPSGRCLRVINPDTKVNYGWINEADLRLTTKPVYESKVDPQTFQMGLDLLVKRSA